MISIDSLRQFVRDLIPTDCWTNGVMSLYQYKVTGGTNPLNLDQTPPERLLWVSLDQGIPNAVEITNVETQAEDILCRWDYDDLDAAEWLAAWRLNDAAFAYLAIPEPGDEGPFRIWVLPHYYGEDAPTAGYLRNEGGEIEEYATYAEAQAVLDEYYRGASQYEGIPPCNVLIHGQYAGDTLTIVEVD